MGKKTKDPEKYAKYVAPLLAKRIAGRGIAPQSESDKQCGLDSTGAAACKRHLAGQVFFGCTCGAVYGQLMLVAETNAVCGCVGRIKCGASDDTCMVLRKHCSSDFVCAGTWHSDFGQVRTWLDNYVAAVKVMWAFRHSTMTLVAVNRLLGSGSDRPFHQAIDVMLLFMNAGELVLVHGDVVKQPLRTFMNYDDWRPGTTDYNRSILQPAYANAYRGYRPESLLMQAFSLGKKCYPNASVGFQWMLSHMHLKPDDVLNFFFSQSGYVGDVRREIERRLKKARVVVVPEKREFGDVRFVVNNSGRLAMSRVVAVTVRSGEKVMLLKELPLPTEIGEQTFRYVQDTVSMVGFVDKGGGVVDTFEKLRWLDLASTVIPVSLGRN